MREIKFRAWDLGASEWIDCTDAGDYSIAFDGGVYVHHYTGMTKIKAELMQYTGFKDKNGVEIYDGDIVKAPHDFGPGGFSDRTFTVAFNEELGSYQWNYWLMDQAEVIGSIHESPELLK